jgi:hypothetical protein
MLLTKQTKLQDSEAVQEIGQVQKAPKQQEVQMRMEHGSREDFQELLALAASSIAAEKCRPLGALPAAA